MKLSRLLPLSLLAFLTLPFATALALPPWSLAVDHPFPVAQAVVVAGNNGLIYIFGGQDAGNVVQNTARSFDPKTNTYSAIANMPIGTRGSCGARLQDGRIVIIGGYNANSLSATQIYDPAGNSWSNGPNQTGGWECAAATAADGKVHLFGGEQAKDIHAVYDPAANTWTAAPPMPTPRHSHGAALGSDGRLYVFGGDPALGSLSIFDPKLNTWSAGAAMPGGNQQFAWASDGASIYVIGGSNSYGNDAAPYYSSVWIYDVAAAKWSIDAQAIVTATREAAADIDANGVIHVFGGSNGKKLAAHQVSSAAKDSDGDGVADPADNCVDVANPKQEDADLDGEGDVCDACPADKDNDSDADKVCGDVDNCPAVVNALQEDADMDGQGDACDACPADKDNDSDADGVCGDVDNCPEDANADQADSDANGVGDACEVASTTGDMTTGDATTGDATTGDATTGDATTGDATTGDATTGDATTGDATSGGATMGDPTTGETPTTGGAPTSDGTTADSSSGGSGSDSDTGGAADDGCDCRSDGGDAPTGGLLAFLLFGALGRRRRR